MNAIEFGKEVLKRASEEYVRDYDPDRPRYVANIAPRVVSLIEDSIVDMGIEPEFFDLPSGKEAIAKSIKMFLDQKLAAAFVAVAEAWVVERPIDEPDGVRPSEDPRSFNCLFAVIYEPDKSFLITQKVDNGQLVGEPKVVEGIAGGTMELPVLH